MRLKLLKLKVSYLSVGRILLAPPYAALAAVAALVILGFLLWVFNLNLLAYIFTNPNISFGGKLAFFFNGYSGIFTNFDSAGAATLLLFSVLIGVNTAAAVYVSRSRIASAGAGRAGAGSLVAAVVGAGCAACGTGILGPLLGAVGAAGSVALAKTVGVSANALGILFVLYGLYGLGSQAASIRAKARNI